MPGVGKSQPMQTVRRQDDGAPGNMSPYQRINTEFGAWTSTPSITMSCEKQDYVIPGAAAPSPSPAASPATATRPCRTFNPRVHGTPRYSKIDKFIEGLDAAYEALPTPLVGSASAPPPSRATPKESASTTQDHHPHQHRKSYQDDRPLPPTRKGVKFAEEVIEIGDPEKSKPSGRSVSEVREPAKEMASDIGGARISRAVRFDYRKRRSDFVKAATVVQSTYRGYKVRRGQPLKYLLVISSVKEKLEELRQQFDVWKIAAWFPSDLTERATMTESVMDLLLQLDSLQGVPVVVREFRKNVLRNVIKFQEDVDGFLCRNSKHGVLFDLTRPEGKAAQGSTNLKLSKAIRNIVVQEPNLIANLRDSKPKACRSGHNGSCREEVNGGTRTSIDVTSEFGSDCQSKIIEDPSYSVHPHGVSGQNFVLWSPVDGQFEKVRVEEKSGEEKLESFTELKKCVVSSGNLDTHVLPDRKKKSIGVRFGIANFGNRSFGKEHLSTIDECPQAPRVDTSPCNSTYFESWRKDTHHPFGVSSWDFTENCQKKDDSKCTVSINKQRSLDIPKDCRIANVYENLVEDHEIRHPQKFSEPDHSSREKWEIEFPADLHLDNLFEIDKTCTSMEETPDLVFEPQHEKDDDLHTAVEGATSKDFCDDDFRCSQTKLNAFPSLVEYVSAKDAREGTIEPLLASNQNDDDMSSLTASELELSSKDKETFRCFGGDNYTESSARISEGNRKGISPDMLADLDSKEEYPCNVVFANVGEQVQKPGIPGSEAIEVGQSTLLENPENVQMLFPSTSVLCDNIREQIDGEPGSEYELCYFDDLETISSCSNCAAYPADCMREPWDFESGIREQMPHQPYALKGLVGELDEVFSERKVEDTRRFEAGYWKDEVWRDYTSTESQPFHVGTITSKPNFEREVQVESEDDSCKSFKTFESDKAQCWRKTAQNLLVETKLASHEEQYPDIQESICLESKRSTLACTSQSLGEEGVASSSIAVASHGDENNLLSKLVEDNKRLKDLLKEVMKWNTVQANAMITLNERLELVESKK